MNSPYSRESAAASGERNISSDGEQSAMLNGNHTAVKLSKRGKKTAHSTSHPSGIWTSENLTDESLNAIGEWLMSFREAPPAKGFQSQARERENTTKEICGRPSSTPFASYDPDTSSLRMSQACLPLEGISDEYLDAFPPSGMMFDGDVYRLRPLERRTGENGAGSLPTPRTSDSHGAGLHGNGGQDLRTTIQMIGTPTRAMSRRSSRFVRKTPTPAELMAMLPMPRANKIGGKSSEGFGPTLEQAVNMLPTPAARDWKGNGPAGMERNSPCLNGIVGPSNGLKLHSNFVEWVMGIPIGASGLEPLAMGKSLNAPPKRGGG